MKAKLLFLSLIILSLSLSSQTIYVDQNATGLDNGTDWTNAYTNLQTAITNIGSNTTINVAQGIYYPTATTDRTIYFSIPRDKKLFGGFPTGGGTRNSELYPTILSGDIGILEVNTDNSYHVVYFFESSSTNEFDGFIVEKGYANGPETYENWGGGICVRNSSSSSFGLYVRNCTIRNNFAIDGGGINITRKADIYNCKIYSNKAVDNGGGISITTDGRIYNSYIANNYADGYGGGIYISGINTAPKAINCVIANNESTLTGAGVNIDSQLINCTVVNNKGNNGVYLVSGGFAFNSIIWGNEVTSSQINIPGSNPSDYLQKNLVQDLTPFGTNFSLSSDNNGSIISENYPKFTNPTAFKGNATTPEQLEEIFNADWSINPQSAAIDFGDNSLYPTTTDTPTVDIIGNNRTINTTIDAGAYEALTNVTTNLATNQQSTSATLSGEIIFAETANTITRGFVYAITPNFDVTIATSVTNVNNGLGIFSDNIAGLTEDQFYYYRAWVEFDGIKYYGNEQKFNTSNLVAYYPFNGNANDESGNGNHGTVNGATLTTDRFGNSDSAYSFDGSNDIITINHNDILNISNELSISVWVKPNPLKNTMILGKSNYSNKTNYLLRTKSKGYIQFEYKDYANSNSLPLTAGVWNHIAVISKSDNSKQVYINGMLATHTSDTSPYGLVTNALTIGARPGAEFFYGSIDDLRIYKSALSEANVLDLYTNNALKVEKFDTVTESNFYVNNKTLYFKNTQKLQEVKTVEVYNTIGQKVFKTSQITNEISFKNLPVGVFILKVTNFNSNCQTLRFLSN